MNGKPKKKKLSRISRHFLNSTAKIAYEYILNNLLHLLLSVYKRLIEWIKKKKYGLQQLTKKRRKKNINSWGT